MDGFDISIKKTKRKNTAQKAIEYQNINFDNKTTNEKLDINEKEIKITKFDIDNILETSKNGILKNIDVLDSPKKDAILKRIQTLVNVGLLIKHEDGFIITDKFIERAKIRKEINNEREKSHSKNLSINCFTKEQKKLIADLKDFLNITGSQIIKYIYNDNVELYKSEIKSLLRRSILRKDKISDTYVLSKEGTKFAVALTGDSRVFGSKINSRREELKHDILVYSAFKDAEKDLLKQGKTIIAVKTDRKLRSEDMKNGTRMQKDYPDLRVEYVDAKTNEKNFLNIEVDIGYSQKVIENKLKNIPNLKWYTNSYKQREKVLSKAKNTFVKVIDEKYWR